MSVPTIYIRSVKACMGGWCRRRENCPNYNSADRRYPAERLCGAIDGIARQPIKQNCKISEIRPMREAM